MNWWYRSFIVVCLCGLLGTAVPTQAATLSDAEIRDRLQLIRTELLALRDRIAALAASEQVEFTITESVEQPDVTASESAPEVTMVNDLLAEVTTGEDLTVTVQNETVEIPWRTASTTKEAQAAIRELDRQHETLRFWLNQPSAPAGARAFRENMTATWEQLQTDMRDAMTNEDLDEFNTLWQAARGAAAVTDSYLDQARAAE